jgi:hypothetical protein
MPRQAWVDGAGKRYWLGASLAGALVLTLALAAALALHRPNPTATFQTTQPGMTYKDVKAALTRRDVAVELARSFGTPVPEAQAALRGEPSFEKQEWGRVDDAWQYESEPSRAWKADHRLPLSTSERCRYTVRQWGIANTQSYAFIAVFDADDVLVCRYWTVPSESRFRGWVRNALGW